jgi:hypothetical protein
MPWWEQSSGVDGLRAPPHGGEQRGARNGKRAPASRGARTTGAEQGPEDDNPRSVTGVKQTRTGLRGASRRGRAKRRGRKVAGSGKPARVGSSGACPRKRVRSGGSGAEIGPQGPCGRVRGSSQGGSSAWLRAARRVEVTEPAILSCAVGDGSPGGRRPADCGRSRSSGVCPEGAREAMRGAVGFDGSRPTVREGRPGRRRNGYSRER